MHKQPEVTARTRQTFVNVFCQIYAQKPIEKITVREITALAGFNRSTFYEYFPDIYALRDYVEDDVLRYLSGELAIDEGGPFDEKEVIRNALRLFEEKKPYLDALLGDYGSIRFQNRLKEWILLNRKPFQDGAEDPLYPYLVEFNVSTILSMFSLWQRRGQDLSAQTLFDLIYQLYSGALERVVCSGRLDLPVQEDESTRAEIQTPP